MRRASTLLCFVWAIGCGDSDSGESGVCGSEKPAVVHECATGYPGAEIETSETAQEFSRDRVGREKGLLPGCLLLISSFSCEFVPNANETHCTGEPWGVMPEKQITVKWHDQDCGTYDGEVFLQTGTTTRELVARFTPIEPGSFGVEGLIPDFEFGIEFSPGVVLNFDDGLCHVNLKPTPDAEGTSSTVALCTDS